MSYIFKNKTILYKLLSFVEASEIMLNPSLVTGTFAIFV